MWTIEIASLGNTKPARTFLMTKAIVLMDDSITIGRRWTHDPATALQFGSEQAAADTMRAEFSTWEIGRFTIQTAEVGGAL